MRRCRGAGRVVWVVRGRVCVCVCVCGCDNDRRGRTRWRGGSRAPSCTVLAWHRQAPFPPQHPSRHCSGARARARPHLPTEEDAAVEEAPAAVEELDGPEAVHPHQQLHRKQLRPPYNTPASCVRGRGRGRVRARPGEKAVRERESWQLCVRAARERARCNRLLRASSLCVPWQGRLKPVEAPPRD